MSPYKYNWDNYPDSRNYREKINNYLNHLLEIETDSNNRAVYIPDVEIKETKEAYYLKFEIPGMSKRQIDLEITSNVVTIRGERTPKKDVEDEKLVFSSFHYGKWQRIIFLPVPITVNGAIAEYADGILKIVLYKLYS
jgi:HSP20 family protein